ncbi:hypothetical protein [Paenibacillus lautus]|uniref:hypothetical protein n=1 Tax=Paenibacillus lautus TaxID=1401 RepID=UPI002DBBA092|nr:hypothetical protein [Paenibacillus lautus]MEC0254600.1 hypothetical protein [Paenibacillus lautus]
MSSPHREQCAQGADRTESSTHKEQPARCVLPCQAHPEGHAPCAQGVVRTDDAAARQQLVKDRLAA